MWAGNDETVASRDLLKAVQDDLFQRLVQQQALALCERAKQCKETFTQPYFGVHALDLYQLSGPEVRVAEPESVAVGISNAEFTRSPGHRYRLIKAEGVSRAALYRQQPGSHSLLRSHRLPAHRQLSDRHADKKPVEVK
ncbi:MAG: hypothetical protein CMB79_18845 [Filomicrobium sp.]|nr:hypothetical protein [Filomicrobium sp.]